MTLQEDQLLPQHVAIIMDGNNRFAKKMQMQKGDGHREGKNVLDPIVEHCKSAGVRALTVFAFSSENWNRPQYEVDLLMKLLEETIHEQLPRLSDHLSTLMHYAEQKTAAFDSMTLTIAISYGGMWDMAHAARSIAQDVLAGKVQTNQINVDLFDKYVSLNDLPAVDLLIRTGGDYRLSNFLLWQAAYAELYFTETLWPEFTVEELDHAFRVFSGRERRFGKTTEQIQQAKIEN